MTNRLTCPFCQQELGIILCDADDLVCSKCRMCGTKNLWAALIQAKHDLEIARKALEDIKSDYELYSEQGCRMEPNETDMYNYARTALEQITHDNSEKPNSQEHKE